MGILTTTIHPPPPIMMVNIDSELPPLEVPIALIRQWIKRYGVWIPHRTGANWEMVIAEAARWGQRQGWDARAAQTSTCFHIVSTDEGTNYCRVAEQSAQGQGLLSYAVGEAKPLQSWGQGHTLVKTPTPMDELRTASAEAQPEQDLLNRARQELARYARPAIEPAPDAKARELLNLLLDDLDALIDNSEGVAGLHLNGDIASWESLREGGTFETWLMRMDEARAHLDSTMAQPEQEGPTDEEIAQCLIAAGVDAMEGESDGTNRMYWEGWHEQVITGIRAVIATDRARYARPAIEPVPVAALPTRVDHVFRLAEIIREVDGNHDKGAAALAEAILSHPGSRWRPTIEPVPVSQRPWEREGWCDADGRCWWGRVEGNPGNPEWFLATREEISDFYEIGDWCVLLPHHALPLPTEKRQS